MSGSAIVKNFYLLIRKGGSYGYKKENLIALEPITGEMTIVAEKSAKMKRLVMIIEDHSEGARK